MVKVKLINVNIGTYFNIISFNYFFRLALPFSRIYAIIITTVDADK